MASTADLEAEILAELEEDPDAYVTPVNDVITIDPETRTIRLPASEMLFGVEEEKDVERKFFKCPRIVGDNIDLAAHQIYISYMAVKDKNATLIQELLPETYWCEDVNVDDTGNYITFSWLLSGNVLRNRGFVGFAVIAKSLEGEVLKTRWKTAPAVGTVLMTIPDGGEEIADLYPDIISQIIAKIEKIESGSISDEVVATAVEKYMEVHPFEEAGTAESKVSEHNTSEASHNDIRLLVQGLTERLNVLADSDDTTLDQMSEVVAYIKSNKSLIDAITTSKVNVSDIIDNLTTNVANKPLSAAQGVKLKALIDAIMIPTKLSELENDSGYAKTTDIPDKLPNPQKLIFSGAVTAEYDGSGAVTVTIPEGSGISGESDEKWEYIGEFTETSQPTFEGGKYRFFYAETFFTSDATSANSYRFLCIDGYHYCRWSFANTIDQKMIMFIAHGLCSLYYSTKGTTYPTSTDRGTAGLNKAGTQGASIGTAFWTTTDSTNYPVATFGIKLWGAK